MTSINPLISVIIPVYNVGEFLIPCLDSLKGQTYKNLEILLIDDGSTDGSGKQCDDCAEKDSRFKVIHKKNGGVSSARNLGLDIAQGEYIAFIDADDCVTPDYFEVLYRDLTEKSVDAAFCDYVLVDEEGKQLPKKTARFSEAKRIGDLKSLIASASSFSVVWGGLFSALCLKGLQFSDFSYGEDTLFMFDWLCTNPVISVNPYPGYTYLQRESSAMHTKTTPKIIKRDNYLHVSSYIYVNLPIKTQEIQQIYLCRYAQAVHDVAYLCALPENRHFKHGNLREHINIIFPDVHMLPEKLRLYILLYAKAPWLYNALARIHNKLRG